MTKRVKTTKSKEPTSGRDNEKTAEKAEALHQERLKLLNHLQLLNDTSTNLAEQFTTKYGWPYTGFCPLDDVVNIFKNKYGQKVSRTKYMQALKNKRVREEFPEKVDKYLKTIEFFDKYDDLLTKGFPTSDCFEERHLMCLGEFIVKLGASHRHLRGVLGISDASTITRLLREGLYNIDKELAETALGHRSQVYASTERRRNEAYMRMCMSHDLAKFFFDNDLVTFYEDMPSTENLLSDILRGNLVVCGGIDYDKQTGEWSNVRPFTGYNTLKKRFLATITEIKENYWNIPNIMAYTAPFRLVDRDEYGMDEDIYVIFLWKKGTKKEQAQTLSMHGKVDISTLPMPIIQAFERKETEARWVEELKKVEERKKQEMLDAEEELRLTKQKGTVTGNKIIKGLKVHIKINGGRSIKSLSRTLIMGRGSGDSYDINMEVFMENGADRLDRSIDLGTIELSDDIITSVQFNSCGQIMYADGLILDFQFEVQELSKWLGYQFDAEDMTHWIRQSK